MKWKNSLSIFFRGLNAIIISTCLSGTIIHADDAVSSGNHTQNENTASDSHSTVSATPSQVSVGLVDGRKRPRGFARSERVPHAGGGFQRDSTPVLKKAQKESNLEPAKKILIPQIHQTQPADSTPRPKVGIGEPVFGQPVPLPKKSDIKLGKVTMGGVNQTRPDFRPVVKVTSVSGPHPIERNTPPKKIDPSRTNPFASGRTRKSVSPAKTTGEKPSKGKSAFWFMKKRST